MALFHSSKEACPIQQRATDAFPSLHFPSLPTGDEDFAPWDRNVFQISVMDDVLDRAHSSLSMRSVPASVPVRQACLEGLAVLKTSQED